MRSQAMDVDREGAVSFADLVEPLRGGGRAAGLPVLPRAAAPATRMSMAMLGGMAAAGDLLVGLLPAVTAASAGWRELAAVAPVATLLFLLLSWIAGHYQAGAAPVRRGMALWAVAWAAVLIGGGLAALLAGVDAASTAAALWGPGAGIAAAGGLAVALWRRWLGRRQGAWLLRVAVLGAGARADALAESVRRQGPAAGMRFCGRYDAAPGDSDGETADGDLEDLLRAVADNRVDSVIIVLPWHRERAIRTACTRLRDMVVDVWLLPDESAAGQVVAGTALLPGIWALEVWRRPLRDWRGVAKRAEDILLGAVLLAGFLPVMLLIGVLVLTSGPGPVLLRQRRYGYGSAPFMMYKFRTMHYNPADRSESTATVKGDKRVTRIGRFLRSTSLDELPQLLNVLRGEMSLVGPRPHLVEMTVQGRPYDEVVPEYLARHRMKPGITGLAQIGGYRGLVDTREKAQGRVDLDLQYIAGWSLRLDLRILWRTLFKGFVSPGAY